MYESFDLPSASSPPVNKRKSTKRDKLRAAVLRNQKRLREIAPEPDLSIPEVIAPPLHPRFDIDESYRRLDAVTRKQAENPDHPDIPLSEVFKGMGYSQQLQEQVAEAWQAQNDWAAERARNDAAWASDDELGTVWGEFKQAMAGVPKMAQRLVAGTASSVVDSPAHALERQISDEAVQVYNKVARGEPLTAAEDAALNGKQWINYGRYPRKQSQAELIAQVEQIRQQARDAGETINDFAPLDGIVNPVRKERLSARSNEIHDTAADGYRSVGEAWDRGDYAAAAGRALTTTGELVAEGVGALVDHPGAVTDHLVESAEYFLPGVNLVANTNYVLNTEREGLEQFSERTGQLPTQNERNAITALAASAGLVNQLSADRLLKGRKAQASKKPDTVERKATEREEIIARLMGNRYTKPVAVAGAAGASIAGKMAAEAGTEGYQALVESDLSQLNFDADTWDTKGVLNNALVGAGVSGQIATGVETVRAARKPLTGTRTVAQTLRDDVQKDDPDSVDTPVTPSAESPTDAAPASSEPDSTPSEVVFPNGPDVDKLVTENTAEGTTEETKKANLRTAQTYLKDVADRLTLLLEQGTDAEHLSEFADPRQRKIQLEKEAKHLESEIVRISEAVQTLQDSAGSDAHKDAMKTVIEAPSRDVVVQVSAQTITDAIARDPDSFSTEELRQLVESTNLDTREKKVLQSRLETKELTDSLKTLDDVHGEIIYGDGPRKGLLDYRRLIVKALKKGKAGKAQRLRSDLERLVHNQSEKARHVSRAYAPWNAANQKGRLAQMTEDATKAAALVQQKYNLKIHAKSGNLVRTVQMEKETLAAGLQEVDALMEAQQVVPDLLKEIRGRVSAANDAAPSGEPASETVPATDTQPLAAEAPKPEPGLPTEQVPSSTDAEALARHDEYAEAFSGARRPRKVVKDRPDTPTPSEPEPQTAPTPDTLEQLDQLFAEDADTPLSAPTPEQLSQLDQFLAEDTGVQPEQVEVQETVPEADEQLTQLFDESTAEAVAEQATESTEAPGTAAPEPVQGSTPEGYSLAAELTQVSEADRAIEADDSLDATAKHKQLNPLSRYFTGRTTGSQGLEGILTRVQGVAQQLQQTPQLALSFLDQDTLGEQDTRILESFAAFNAQMTTKIREITRPHKYRYKDFSNAALYTEQGELREDVATAVNAAIYTWIATQASGLLHNDRKTINRILGRDNDAALNRGAWNLLGRAGTPQQTLVERLGRDIVAMLGLKPRDTAPGNMKASLEVSMGDLALGVLLDSGYLSHQTLTKGQLAEVTGQTVDKAVAKQEVSFVRPLEQVTPNPDKPGYERVSLAPEMETIYQLNRGSSNFIGRLFQSAMAPKPPTLKPKTTLPQHMKGTRQQLPQAVQEALLEHQSREHTLTETWDLFSVLDPQHQERIAGVQHDLSGEHLEDRAGIEGKNASLQREIENLVEWATTLQQRKGNLRAPFYLSHNPWSQLRVGIGETLVNPQGSKVHRGLIRMQAWEAQLSVNPEGKHFPTFQLALAQALGIGVDKLTVDGSIQALEEKLAEPVIRSALDAIAVLRDPVQSESLSPEQRSELQQAVVDGVSAGKEGTHTLHGLVNHVRYEQAIREGKGTFEVDLMLEADGLTNGVAIGTLQLSDLGLKGPEAIREGLAQFGMFTDEQTSLGDWFKQPGNMDRYKVFAKAWRSELVKQVGDRVTETQARILAEIFGPLTEFDVTQQTEVVTKEGRNRSKPVVMAPMYSQGAGAVKEGIAAGFWERVRKQIRDTVADPALTEREKMAAVSLLDQQLRHLADTPQQAVIQSAGKLELGGSQQALDTRFNARAMARIDTLIGDTYGDAAGEVIEQQYGDIKHHSQAFNRAFEGINTIFRVMYDHAVEKRKAELVAEGKLSAEYHTLPQQELDQIQDALRNAAPIMGSYFEPQNPETGIAFLKTEKQSLDQAGFNGGTASAQFGRPLQRVDAAGKPVSTVRQIKSEIKQRVFAPLGVKSMVMAVQHVDAATAISTLKNHRLLNVHDGFGGGVTQVQAATRALNENFIQINGEYSLTQQAQQSFDRALEALAAYEAEQGVELKGAIENELKAQLRVSKQETGQFRQAPLDFVYKGLERAAGSTGRSKANLVGAINYTTQYNLENAGFTSEKKPEASAATTTPAPEKTPRPVHLPLKAFLEANPQTTLKAVLDTVIPTVKGAGPQQKAIRALLTQLGKLDRKTQLKYLPEGVRIEADAQVQAQLERPENIALTVTDGAGATIYLKGNDQAGRHGLSLETLTHEALHSVLDQVLARKDKLTGTRKTAYVRLQNIRGQVKQYLNDNPDSYTIQGNELDNVNEMVTWALTNADFQQLLKQVSTPLTRGQKLSNAFRTLVDSLQTLLFGNTAMAQSDQMNTALYQIIDHAGVLLDAAADPVENSTPVMSPQQINDNDRVNTFRDLSSAEVLEALGQQDTDHTRSVAHNNHLKDVQAEVLNTVAGAHGEALKAAEEALGDSTEQFIRNLRDDALPFVSSIQNQGFDLSWQEIYVAEQLEAVLGPVLDQRNRQVRELDTLWELARDRTDYRIFMVNGASQEQAQQQWDALFNPEVSEQRKVWQESAKREVEINHSSYLRRFAALAMVSEPLRTALDTLTVQDEKLPERPTVTQRLQAVVRALVQQLSRLMGNRYIQESNGKKRTDALLKQLAEIEVRKKQQLERATRFHNSKLGQVTDASVGKVTGIVLDTLRSERLRNTRIPVLKQTLGVVGTVADQISQGSVEQFMDRLQHLKHQLLPGKHGLMNGIFDEVRGATTITRPMFERLRHAKHDIEQARSKVTEWTRRQVEDYFAEPLTVDEQKALNRILLNADAQALRGHYSRDEIEQLLSDPVALNQAIQTEKQKLHGMQWTDAWLNEAKALGYRMITGETRSPLGARNAHNIAYLGGSGKTVNEQEAQAALPVLERLVTLHALSYTDMDQRKIVVERMRKENHREDNQDGILMLLDHIRGMEQEAVKTTFADSPWNMEKGYSFRITNPYKSIEFANAEDGVLLQAQGYLHDHDIQKDPSLPDSETMGVYVINDGGMKSWLSGAFSFTGRKARGTSLMDALVRQGKAVAGVNNRQLVQAMQQRRQPELDAYLNFKGFDPEKATGHRMVPTLNAQGQVHDFRLTMTRANMNRLLEVDERISHVLGAQAGNRVDKENSVASNQETLKLIHRMWQEGYEKQPESFVAIHADSDVAQYRDMWAMMSGAERERVKELFGEDKLYVRSEVLYATMGYRKPSVMDAWRTDPAKRKLLQKWVVNFAEKMLGQKAHWKLSAVSQGHKEIVRQLKDILVIRNFFTLVGNILSNLSLLFWSGVPIRGTLQLHTEGYQGLQDYQAHEEALFRVNQQLDYQQLSSAQRRKLQAQKVRLEHQLSTNPVRPLMEAGVFQTIVEDIEQTEDPYSYKTQLMEKLSGAGERVNPTFLNGLKWVALTKDTGGYRFLNHTTQVSDFVARYAKYKHLTEHAAQPLPEDQAIEQIMEDFIQYDIPSSPALQWLNDNGLVMFSKYYLRIQKPLLRLLRDAPLRGMLLISGQGLVDFPTPMDSNALTGSLLNRFYNPLDTMISTPDEIAPVNVLLHLTGVKD